MGKHEKKMTHADYQKMFDDICVLFEKSLNAEEQCILDHDEALRLALIDLLGGVPKEEIEKKPLLKPGNVIEYDGRLALVLSGLDEDEDYQILSFSEAQDRWFLTWIDREYPEEAVDYYDNIGKVLLALSE